MIIQLEFEDTLDAVKAIREGLEDMKEGRVRDARTALEELRTKLNLQH